MTYKDAAEHARAAAIGADNASLISAGLFSFADDIPRGESEYPRLAFETLAMAVGELARAVEKLAEAEAKV